jgi:hypothetical protein
VKTTNAGPYDFPDGQIDWGMLLQGDAFWQFLQVRKASYGSEYTFSEQCKCGSRIDWTINLDEDLKFKPLPQSSADAFRAETPLETRLEDGRLVQFRLLLMNDNPRIMDLNKNRKIPWRYAAIAQRLVHVEGVEGGYFELVRFVEDMDAGEADLLEEKMEEQDCGADTNIQIVCDKCFFEQEVMLPFEASFFRRQRKKTSVEQKKHENSG